MRSLNGKIIIQKCGMGLGIFGGKWFFDVASSDHDCLKHLSLLRKND
jgi:hypothetical protein